eukprot:gene30810-34772_t
MRLAQHSRHWLYLWNLLQITFICPSAHECIDRRQATHDQECLRAGAGRVPAPAFLTCRSSPMTTPRGRLARAALCLTPVLLLAACGGGSSDPVFVANADASVPANATVAGAVAGTSFSFASGVAALGTTGATTVAFSGTA